MNLNYLKFIKFGNELIENEIDQVDVIKNLTLIGSIFNAIKQSYDRIIWRGYTIENEDSTIKLISDERELMLDNAALTRLTRNISSKHYELQYSDNKYSDIIKYYHTTRKHQIIKSIEVNGDDLKINYKAKSRTPSFSYFAFTAPLLTYYPFYRSQAIPSLQNLSILDLVNLFSSLFELIDNLPMPSYEDTGIVDLAKFKLFNPKLKKSTLLNYYKNISKYSEEQILIFLDLLTQKGKKHNLYNFPLYESGEYYFFSHSNIKRANMLYLIDKWLDAGNCDLSERGYAFEDYISDFLKTEPMNKFAKFEVVNQSKFAFLDTEGNPKEEEIDLVIKTDSTLILAEVKCIMYPLDSDDFYNSHQIIKKAKKQIVRKAKFIEENWNHFEYVLGKKVGKKVEKIIIVNFPHFAGRTIDGIPITDFYLFLSYFKSGKLSSVKLERHNNPIFSEIPYYDSIQSFQDNFHTFFLNPTPIEDLVSRQEIQEYEVTMKGTIPKVISQRVLYHPKV